MIKRLASRHTTVSPITKSHVESGQPRTNTIWPSAASRSPSFTMPAPATLSPPTRRGAARRFQPWVPGPTPFHSPTERMHTSARSTLPEFNQYIIICAHSYGLRDVGTFVLGALRFGLRIGGRAGTRQSLGARTHRLPLGALGSGGRGHGLCRARKQPAGPGQGCTAGRRARGQLLTFAGPAIRPHRMAAP